MSPWRPWTCKFLVSTYACFLCSRSEPDARQLSVSEILHPISYFTLLLLCHWLVQLNCDIRRQWRLVSQDLKGIWHVYLRTALRCTATSSETQVSTAHRGRELLTVLLCTRVRVSAKRPSMAWACTSGCTSASVHTAQRTVFETSGDGDSSAVLRGVRSSTLLNMFSYLSAATPFVSCTNYPLQTKPKNLCDCDLVFLIEGK